MGFINNANQIIGDNMRYLQQLKSNPQLLTGSQASAPSMGASPAGDPMAMMMPMLMMMMFQLMGQNSAMFGQAGSGQTGQNPYQTNQDPFGALPPAMPMPPFQTPPNALPPQDQGQAQWIQQNPAYQFLTAQLGGSAANSTTSAAAGGSSNAAIIPPSFDDNASIAITMNALLANNPDQNLRTLGTQLLSGNLNGTDFDALKGQVENELIQQGSGGHDLDAFGVLYDAMQNNNALDQAQILNATNPSTTNANQVAQLTQNQQEFATQWGSLYPDYGASTATNTATNTTSTTTTPASQDLTQSVQNALASGQFTPTELGQSLKYLLDHAPSEDMGSLTGLISNLTKAGQLNILPFLHSKYLDKLPPVRQEALLGAVEDAGLTLSNGQPNSRLAGYLLENLSRPGTSSTQNFLAQFLQNEWLTYGQDTTSAEGKALANVMSLAGLQGTVGQPLNLVQ